MTYLDAAGDIALWFFFSYGFFALIKDIRRIFKQRREIREFEAAVAAQARDLEQLAARYRLH